MGNNGAKLKFVSGEYAGAEIDLAPFADVTLGRNPEIATFVFNSEGVSRRHCIIQYNPNDRRFRVTDLSSSGTIINNVKKMERGNVEYLSAGDTLKIGHSSNVVQLVAPPKMENTGVRPAPGYGGYSGGQNMGETGVLGGQDRATVKMGPGMVSSHPNGPGYQNNYQNMGRGPVNGGAYNTPNNQNVAPWSDGSKSVSKEPSDVLGIIGICIGGIACLVALGFLLYLCGDYFKAKCLVFVALHSGWMWVILLAAIAGLVLGIIYLIQMSGTRGEHPKWMGVVAIVGAVLAITIVIIIYVSAITVSASDIYEYGLKIGNDLVDDYSKYLGF